MVVHCVTVQLQSSQEKTSSLQTHAKWECVKVSLLTYSLPVGYVDRGGPGVEKAVLLHNFRLVSMGLRQDAGPSSSQDVFELGYM